MFNRESVIEIVVLSGLFIYSIFLKDEVLYFQTIYILVLVYNIYKIYKLIEFNLNLNCNRNIISNCFTFIILTLPLYFFSYFLIYEANPIYYLFTFYLPFQNYFKSIFIIMIHSYFINKLFLLKKRKYEIVQSSPDKVKLTIPKAFTFNDISRFEYPLSNYINYFKNNKKKAIYFIACLIIIKIIIFSYSSKFWIYFDEKEKILPISTSRKTKFYITAVLYNIQPIAHDYINEIKKLITYLGEDKIIVSIVENGDSTDKTRDYLENFQKYLDSKNITNKFVLTKVLEDPRKNLTVKKDIKYARIKYLAELRNKCFDLLYKIPNLEFNNTKIIYINDIIFTYEDIVKLLSTNNEDYDAVCAMDYYYNFYDTWVSIDLNGNNLREGFPYFINKEAQYQLINKKPIRVFSCWNGVIVFTSEVFKDKRIKFRVEKPDNNTKYKLNTYIKSKYESECTNFHIDLQSLGYTKRLINTDVRVAYEYKFYFFSKYILPNTLEIILYFGYYLKSFTEKRNKYMSNLKDKTVKLSKRLENWYLYNINKTSTKY